MHLLVPFGEEFHRHNVRSTNAGWDDEEAWSRRNSSRGHVFRFRCADCFWSSWNKLKVDANKGKRKTSRERGTKSKKAGVARLLESEQGDNSGFGVIDTLRRLYWWIHQSCGNGGMMVSRSNQREI